MERKRLSPDALDVVTDDHVQGPDDAPITLIAYCDFECPYCGRAHQQIKDLQERFPGRLRFVFRHFPLDRKHPAARQAAEAAEAAASQQRFWPMYDLLFEYQEELETGDLYTYAGMAGLDVPRFKEELHGRIHASRVLRDIESGRRHGVDGTPTFFLNSRKVADDEELERLVLRAA